MDGKILLFRSRRADGEPVSRGEVDLGRLVVPEQLVRCIRAKLRRSGALVLRWLTSWSNPGLSKYTGSDHALSSHMLSV